MIKGEGQITKNKKAYHDYEIEATYEAGIVLQGSEVKSLRQGKANLADSYAHIHNAEVYLRNCHISPYDHGGYSNHEPMRERKILLHKREIKKLIGKIKERGYTLIPLKMYFVKGKAKVLLGLARGKRLADKRQDIKERDLRRDMEREFKDKLR